MTEEFEKWVDERTHIAPSEEDHGSRACVNYWLTAFVKDCYKDAISLCLREHVTGQGPTEHPCDMHFMIVFERKVRDFGLEDKP